MSVQEPRPAASLPPLGTMETALHKTTETLAREISQPTRHAPAWTDFEWRMAEAAAAIQGICALLSRRLRWRGPQRWHSFLEEQTLHTRLRHQRIQALLGRMDEQLRETDVAAVALKGSALYRMGLYPNGERPMGDVDLLLHTADLDVAMEALLDADYEEGVHSARHKVLSPVGGSAPVGFGEHADNPIKIELHTHIADPLPAYAVDITAHLAPREMSAGLNSYPSTAALLRHLLLHAAGNMRARALRSIQLHDIALLAPLMTDGDWRELLLGSADSRGLWWAFAPFVLTNRYYPSSIPQKAIEATTAGCPALLRRASLRHGLADVSWANIRVRAFPGIEWARTAPEALAYMRSRLFPRRAVLSELQTAAKTARYASAVEWYGLSHANRVARWIFSRPPRVQTIYPIQVALGHRPP